MSMQMIPLNQLVASSANVRKTDAKADIEALAASIAAHGLLQNLSVQQRSETKFEVVAGARRHAALKLLVKDGKLARDYPVACNLVDPDGASETSLAENVQRVAMNAMDEADAFNALREQGLEPDAIARRFGATTRHVEQRLALAGLSAKVKAAYRRDDINLDAARAFCIEPDHAKQDAVLRALGKPITHAGQVRALLMQGSMKATDRLARFVGLEAYEAAGGAVSRDLFDPDTIFIADPGLITRLADERLEGVRQDLLSQGWGWVEISTGHGGSAAMSGQRIQPARRPMTRSERAALARLDAEIEALDAQLNDSEDDDDAAWRTREERETERQALMERTQTWDAELIAHAGVVAAIDHEGRLAFNYGVVAKADAAKLKRVLAARAPEGAAQTEDAPAAEADHAGPRLPKAVARDLTAARSAALRLGVANAPDIALALITFACITSALKHRRTLALGVAAESVALSDLPAFERRRGDVLAALPGEDGDALGWCLSQDRETLLDVLAVLAAEALDLVHEGASSADISRQRFADTLAAALDLDMRQYWSPDRDFLARLSKPMLMEILANAPSVTAKSVKRREAILKAQAKLKRDDLAKAAAKALDGVGWLPDILVTPIGAGALAVTAEGEAEAHAIAAE
jgi:ParB family chromosome partitioning protein